MADSQRKAELVLGIRSEGAKAAAADIDKIASEFADIAKQSGSTGSALRLAVAEAQKIGATDEDIKRLNKSFNDYRKTVEDTVEETRELATAQKEVTGNAPDASGGGEGPTLGGRITRAGSALRGLPSVQIPGTGIGTDAIGNIARLSGALVDVAGKSSLVTAATTALTPALGAEAAATVAAAAPIAVFVAGFAAIGLAIKVLTDETSKNVDRINTFAESQRKLSDKIAEGLTSKEAQAELDKLNTRRDRETETLNTLQKAYDDSARQLSQATIAGVNVGNTFGNVARIFSGDEQKLADQIEKSKQVFQDTQGDYDALTGALEDGSLAANDAKVAEEELAKTRSDAALKTADNVGKELQAQQRADDASAEQNEKRLGAIADEKEVIDAQITSLEASGVTSEEVTSKIAALKDQLGLLGKESDYISGTALEASKARDAEKKAAKDAEDAQKKAAQAQDQYAKAVQNANTTYKQAVQDSGVRLRYAYIDNAEKTNRELESLDTKYKQDEFDLQLKANRATRNAALDQIDDLKKLQKDAQKSEQEALRDGDFKQLFLSRESAKESADELQQKFNDEAQKRQIAQSDALEDLQRDSQRQRDAKLLSYRYADIDARTAQQRELSQAATARQRNLQAASEALNAELRLRQTYWNAVVKQTQQAIGQITGLQVGAAGSSKASAPQAFVFKTMQSVIRR